MVKANIDAAALASSLRRVSRTDQDGGGLRESLQAVVDACAELFNVDGSGLMLADEQSELRYSVATDGPGQLLEDVQMDLGEGPCIDAFVHQDVILVDDFTADDRYRRVAEKMVPHGVVAMLGVPVRLSDIPVGSLDVYRSEQHYWDQSERQALTRYADVVQATMHAAVAADRAGELAQQLNYALEYRAPIERGIGYLMARDHVDHADAFNRLRLAARRSRRKIGDVAEQLLRTGRLPEETR